MLSFEELKQVIKEQEEQSNQNTQATEDSAENLKRLQLCARLQEAEAKNEAAKLKLEILRAQERQAEREHREKAKRQQKQQNFDNIIYLFSLFLVAGVIIASIIFTLTIF